MATVREAGAAGTVYRALVKRYFPGHEMKRAFTAGEIDILARVADLARKFGRPVEVYIEAACTHEKTRCGVPPTLVTLSGERYMQHLIQAGAVNLWAGLRKRTASEEHQRRIHEILNDRRYWDLITVPAEELVGNAHFCELFEDETQPLGIWQASVVRYLEAHQRKSDRVETK
ncbi:MAG: hypothetical protein ABFD77_09565 [Thermotogota bacterium]